MLGATGAVGGETLKVLSEHPEVEKLNLLGRREVENISNENVIQHKVNIFDPETYNGIIKDYDVAICTLGVGQPTKVSKEDFIKIDKTSVIDFAKACKNQGVKHFQLLGSVGANPKSASHYLRIKGELVEALKALDFDRLSVFQPSMIITPTNRYGFSQALTLAFWPIISPLLFGSFKKYRGIKVAQLGKAIALNSFTNKSGFKVLTWEDFVKF